MKKVILLLFSIILVGCSSEAKINPESYNETVTFMEHYLDLGEGVAANVKDDNNIVEETRFGMGNIVTANSDGSLKSIRLVVDNYAEAEDFLNILNYPITKSFSWTFDLESEDDIRHRGNIDFSKHENRSVLAERYGSKNGLQFFMTISFDEDLTNENEEYANKNTK